MEDYMLITQAEKNRAEFRLRVVKLKTDHPDFSIMKIAKLLNSSYTRVQPIIKASGLQTTGRTKHSYKLTPRVKQKITSLYVENPKLTLVAIAKQVSVSDGSVGKVLEEAGLRTRQKIGKPSKSHFEMIRLKHENPTRTLQSIADELGCTRERVRQIFKRHGLDKQYPVDKILSERNNTYRNCKECNTYIPTDKGTRYRRLGICYDCNTAKRLAKKYSKFICPQCGNEFTMREREYYWRQVRKQQYIDKTGNGKEVTPVTCSYTCSTLIRKFGETDGWGSQRHRDSLESKRKYTPEILRFIVEARKNKTPYAVIVTQLKDTFNLDTTVNTLGSLRYRKLLGEE